MFCKLTNFFSLGTCKTELPAHVSGRFAGFYRDDDFVLAMYYSRLLSNAEFCTPESSNSHLFSRFWVF